MTLEICWAVVSGKLKIWPNLRYIDARTIGGAHARQMAKERAVESWRCYVGVSMKREIVVGRRYAIWRVD